MTTSRARTQAWIDAHLGHFVALLRVYLGVALFVRGIFFVRHGQMLVGMIDASTIPWSRAFTAHYVAFAHVAGGALLAAGLLGRLGAALQIPVLLGAVIYVHAAQGLFTQSQSLELSMLVLVLLVFFAVVGSGPISVDAAVRNRALREAEAERRRAAIGPDEP